MIEQVKSFLLEEKRKIIIASTIVILLLAVIFFSNNNPINIAVGIGMKDMDATADIIVEHNGEPVALNYLARYYEDWGFFLLAPYDFIMLDIKEIVITTSQPIPYSEVQVGYILNRPVVRYHVQDTFTVTERENDSPFYTYIITREQADEILQITSSQTYSTIRLSAFVLVLFAIYLISITKMVITKKILIIITFALALLSIGIAVWRSITFVWIFFVALMALCGIFYEDVKIRKRILIYVIYGSAILLTISRLHYLGENFVYLFDESAHLSYIDYLVQNPTTLVPQFENMNIHGYEVVSGERWFRPENRQSIGLNYLGHPPLYYQIMRFIGGSNLGEGVTLLHYTRILLVSILFFLTGTGLYIYIALSRFKEEVTTHLLVATGLCAYTLYIYSFTGVNNDALGFLTVAIFFLGAFRFVEEKYNLLTFFLITTSISMAVLTKLNIGLTVFVIGIALLFTEVVLRKNYQLLRNWRLYLSFISFIPPLVYYIKHYFMYNTFVASLPLYNPMGFREHSFFGDVNYMVPLEPIHLGTIVFRMLSSRLLNEEGGYLLIPLVSPDQVMNPTNFLPNLPFVLLYGGAAVALFAMALKAFRSYKYSVIFTTTAISVLISIYFLADIVYSNVFTTARLGGVQVRYFFHTIPIAVLALAYLIEILREKFHVLIQESSLKRFQVSFNHILVIICVLVLFEKMVLSFIS